MLHEAVEVGALCACCVKYQYKDLSTEADGKIHTVLLLPIARLAGAYLHFNHQRSWVRTDALEVAHIAFAIESCRVAKVMVSLPDRIKSQATGRVRSDCPGQESRRRLRIAKQKALEKLTSKEWHMVQTS